ncbi:hypothetical protein ES707_17464 [subsurface metagenome]
MTKITLPVVELRNIPFSNWGKINGPSSSIFTPSNREVTAFLCMSYATISTLYISDLKLEISYSKINGKSVVEIFENLYSIFRS